MQSLSHCFLPRYPVSVLVDSPQPPAVPVAARLAPSPGTLFAMPLLYAPVVDVGVPQDRLAFFSAPEDRGRQRMGNWCWAACIQMILNYHGLNVSQEDIVARAFGDLEDTPANAPQIIASLHGWAPNQHGGCSVVTAEPIPLDNRLIAGELTQQKPLLVALGSPEPGGMGHAYVLTAGRYVLDSLGQPHMLQVVLRDPWPSNPSRIEMSYAEFQSRCEVAIRTSVASL